MIKVGDTQYPVTPGGFLQARIAARIEGLPIKYNHGQVQKMIAKWRKAARRVEAGEAAKHRPAPDPARTRMHGRNRRKRLIARLGWPGR